MADAESDTEALIGQALAGMGAFPAEVIAALARQAETVVVEGGGTVVSQGDTIGGFWVVAAGRVTLLDQSDTGTELLREEGPGKLIAVSLTAAGGRSLVIVRAADEVTLLYLRKEAVSGLGVAWPDSAKALEAGLAAAGERLAILAGVRRSVLLSGIALDTVRDMADRATLVMLPAGEALFFVGDPGDALYVVINGRLGVLRRDESGVRRLIGEVGPGDSTGELGAFSGDARQADVVSLRDSTLVRIGRQDYLSVLHLHPEAITGSLLRTVQGYNIALSRMRRRQGGALPTLALVGSRPGLNLQKHARVLVSALQRRGTITLVTSDVCREAGYDPYAAGNDSAAMVGWLNDLEYRYGCVLYVADEEDTAWSRRCLRQVEHILVVADTADPPQNAAVTQPALAEGGHVARQQRTLILLRPTTTSLSVRAAEHKRAYACEELLQVALDDPSGWERVARFLSGHAVGVVLGGGGARGFAHIGILRALEEAGVPVDVVGGTSVGALIGAQYVGGMGPEEILSNLEGMVNQGEGFTLPMVSMLSGQRLSRRIGELFGDKDIEDMARRFFCISCNLTSAETMVHTSGPMRKAVLASNSPPGLYPPVIENGELLVDGGLVNGLPLDVMNQLNSNGMLVVVDVQPKKENFVASIPYNEGLSGWRVLRHKLFKTNKKQVMPGFFDILTRSLTIASLATRAQVLKRKTDLLVRPPLGIYSMGDHKKGREIALYGYEQSRDMIAEWWASQPKL